MRWYRSELLQRCVIVTAAVAGGSIGSSQGGLLDIVAYAAGWSFVAWAAIRQPAVLLLAAPASILIGIFGRSWGAGTSGAFLGTLAYWAITAPHDSQRRRFSLHFFDNIISEELSKPILIFLLAVPFILVGVFVLGGTGHLIAGDTGAVIGVIAGILLGFLGAMRYFDRVHERLSSWQMIVLAVVAVVVSITWERVPGGFAVATTLYVALGIGLIVWSQPRRQK